MGLFDKFKKKDAPQQPQAQAQQPNQQQQHRQNQPPQQDGSAPSFVFGVQVYGTIKDSPDMLVIGRVKGTVKVGMGVYVSALGVEDAEVLVTTVKEIQVFSGSVGAVPYGGFVPCSVRVQCKVQ